MADVTRTLRSAVFRHENDFGIDPRSDALRLPALSVSCVVPYYETGSLAWACVDRLVAAVDCYAGSHAVAPATQVVVVDDGSVRRPFVADARGVRVVRLPQNRGRSAARNVGLRVSAGFDVTLFVDSDVLVPADHVVRVCELWDSGAPRLSVRAAVVAGLFATVPSWSEPPDRDAAVCAAGVAADWRWRCRYQPSWVGTPSDWLYVGQVFELVRGTEFFRQWRGMVGPWALPNMVLGGSFAVPTQVAIDVGGFDESFAAYGFTETSLVARVVAAGVPVVPQVKAAAVHVEANPAHHSRQERNRLFEAAHRRFFREFLSR